VTRSGGHVPEALNRIARSVTLSDAASLSRSKGNFIEASWDTPFFQIGETKYGRPILIRGYDRKMSFEDATKLLMVSFDSTLKANLSVGLPLDLLVIRRDEYKPLHERRIEHGDSYFDAISASWSDALRNAFHSLPDYTFKEKA
jgi:putative proteasome-type protease